MASTDEIIMSPYVVYSAPVGEAFPAIHIPPGGNWFLLGKNGTRSMEEGGVTISFSQNINKVRTAGSAAPIKVARTEEDLMVSFTLYDMTPEAIAKALRNEPVDIIAAASGVAGVRSLHLWRGVDVPEIALLIRGKSPYDNTLNAQFQIPRACLTGSSEVQFSKGNPAGWNFEYSALSYLDAANDYEGFGKYIAQTAPPLA